VATQESYDYRLSWPVNPAAPVDSPEAKAPFIDNGSGPIPTDRYYSAEWMERERLALWPKVWNWAAREEDVPEPGDFKTFSIGRESFILIRGEDNRVRAFFNVCPHRGNRLVWGEVGALPLGITCPFHNWRFSFDGKIAHVTDRETFRPESLRRNLNLTEVRCESWEGFVFINMDPEASPLMEKLGPLPAHAEPYRLKDMRIMRRVQSVWPANWKVGFDGFAESYHVHAIHPQILPIFNDYHAQIDLYPNGMSRAITKFANESPRLRSEILNADLRATMIEVGIDPDSFSGCMEDVRPAVQSAKRDRATKLGLDYSNYLDSQLTDDWNYSVFPNILLGLHPEGANLLYFRPHPTDPRQFIFDVIILMHPQEDASVLPPAYMGLPAGTDLSGRHPAETVEVDWRKGGLGQLFDQDSNLFSQIQQGVESMGFRGAVLSGQEARLGHFHAELNRYLDAT
jgi:phenylpropionate dioxygenase-like ring-hydroxylating dioxygenase large terminal subunit